MRSCALCGRAESTATRLFVAQEPGTEDATSRPVAPGDLVCWRHVAHNEAGEYVRIEAAEARAIFAPDELSI